MKNITHKLVVCAALIIGCLLPTSVQAEGKGHRQSGIIGRVQIEQIGIPLNWQVRVSTDSFKSVTILQTDADGQFFVNLKPGTYRLSAFVGGLVGPSIQVRVTRKNFTIVELPIVSGPS